MHLKITSHNNLLFGALSHSTLALTGYAVYAANQDKVSINSCIIMFAHL